YFYDFNMRKIMQALDNFDAYIHKKVEENQKTQNILNKNTALNARQKELIRYFFVKGDEAYITPSSYIEWYKVSRQTTLTDLKTLVAMGLLKINKTGRQMRYYPADKLNEMVDNS